MAITKKEIEKQGYTVTYYVASGKGGQHRNRTASACRIQNKELDILVTNADQRSQHQNLRKAWEQVQDILDERKAEALEDQLSKRRKAAIDRGTIRTYNFPRGVVKDHITGKEAPLKKVLNGQIDLLK